MILHDTRFEELAEAPIKRTDVEVVRQLVDIYGTFDDSLAYWTSSDLLMSVILDNVGAFLGTTTKKATVKLIGIIDTAKVGELFQIRLGLYDDDPSVAGFNYLSEGFFIVDNIAYDYDSGSTTVTMYDHMWGAQNTSYTDTNNSSQFTYPSTIENLALQLAGAIGTDLMPDFSNLPNADFVIDSDPYTNISNATLASVIHEIAGATGTTARISDTTLVFSQIEIADDNLDSSTLKKLKIGKQYGPVTSVILGRVPQNDNIAIASTAPESNLITNINTSTNLFTITAHGMSDGNLIRIESDDTLPSPLQANTNYFVYTNGDPDTFALAPTYTDGLAGTNLIDLTSAGSGNIIISHLQTQEVQINNNQILDKDRQDTLPPIYTELVGIEWNEVKSNTVGLGWYEVGDVIQFTQGSTTVRAFISEIHLVLAGSVKEELVSVVPDVATINYQTAGGVLRTLYNTEIEVDKQNNTITSVVSQQDVYQTQTLENFTQIYQDLQDILLTIQKSGGGNLILNSVGYATESALDNDSQSFDKLMFWDYNPSYDLDTHGTVTSYSSSESQNAGGVSGQVIEMAGTDVTLVQRVSVAVDTPLSFGIRVNNVISSGTALITLTNDNDYFEIVIDDLVTYQWQEFKLEDFMASQSWFDVTISIDNADSFMFTDLRLLYGNTLSGWTQAGNEILSTFVQFTKDGMRIFDDDHQTLTQVTYNEFSTRRKADDVVLFEADDSGIITNDLTIKGVTNYVNDTDTIIKQVTIPQSSDLAGIAFIKVI